MIDRTVKMYKYWKVMVHENQEYLGRCIVWCLREEAQDLTEATKEEQEELFLILKEIKKALEKSFNSDWMNYSFLSNGYKHLHGHIVPRYQAERNFAGKTFTDKRWGYNWQLDESFETSLETLEEIKNKIISNL